jgi:hypothetical protein
LVIIIHYPDAKIEDTLKNKLIQITAYPIIFTENKSPPPTTAPRHANTRITSRTDTHIPSANDAKPLPLPTKTTVQITK